MGGSGRRAERCVFGRAVFGAVGVITIRGAALQGFAGTDALEMAPVVYNPLSRRASMDQYSFGRRSFLKKITHLTLPGIPSVPGPRPRPPHPDYAPPPSSVPRRRR